MSYQYVICRAFGPPGPHGFALIDRSDSCAHGHIGQWTRGSNGQRWCRACDRERKRRSRSNWRTYQFWLGACPQGHEHQWRWDTTAGDWSCQACTTQSGQIASDDVPV
jgi:hypothetical protein